MSLVETKTIPVPSGGATTHYQTSMFKGNQMVKGTCYARRIVNRNQPF